MVTSTKLSDKNTKKGGESINNLEKFDSSSTFMKRMCVEGEKEND